MLIAASLRLGDDELAARARQALSWQSVDMARDPFVFATQIAAYQLGSIQAK
jgi:hypothetical protein